MTRTEEGSRGEARSSIYVAPFQPFKSRQGQDVVYALRCTYAWPLVELLRRLHGQGVEAEVDSEQLAHRAVGRVVIEVEPEETRPAERGQHVLRRRRPVFAVLTQGSLQHTPSLTSARWRGWDGDQRSSEPRRVEGARRRRLV